MLGTVSGCRLSTPARELNLVHTFHAMGTTFNVTLPEGSDPDLARLVETEVRHVEDVLTDYDAGSEARRCVARAGARVEVGEILAEALGLAEQFWRQTDGAVDVTVGPLTRLWRRAARQQELPEDRALERARAATGWQRLEVGEGTVMARVDGMRLDFGAFGKGFALDRAASRLRAAGQEVFLLDGGGDLLAGEAPPGREAWRVSRQGLTGVLERRRLRRQGLATSGLGARPLELEGQVVGHILDPRQGAFLSVDRAASAQAPTAAASDAWATALCVLGGSGIDLLPPNVSACLEEASEAQVRSLCSRSWSEDRLL